jgi:protein tyrosine phosphatase
VIVIQKSKTADTRSCDFSKVSKGQLLASSYQHIDDVKRGMAFIAGMMVGNASLHDHDKITDIDQFHADFVTGFKSTVWWDNHKRVNRHHLQTLAVPEDVNLIDVMEMIVDCVMAGMGRTGNVTTLEIDPEVLMTAFHNTVELMKSQVVVED